MKLKDGRAKLHANLGIFLLSEDLLIVLTEIITIEAALEGEGMSDHKLLPGNYPTRAKLVRFHFEPTILIVE